MTEARLAAPSPGPGLALDEKAVFADFGARVSLAGTDVAEIGGSVPVEWVRERGVASWTGVDPHRSARTEDGYQVLAAPAEAMPLPAGSVDAVFSSNALEFVDVPAVLAEVRRVLRPGGLLYAHFGPIWSGIDGHQLEYVTYRGRDLVFWKDTLLPPWAHLAYERDELAAVLASALPVDLVELLLRHVYDSTTVNRLFFEDYVEAALDSGLEWVEVTASNHLDYELADPGFDSALVRDVSPVRLSEQWSDRRGRRIRLGPRDVRMVLRQPAD